MPQLFVSGITMGAIYALVALGFVIIVRASQILNFAQGEFVMLGGVLTFFFISGAGLPYPLAALVAVIVVTIIGLLLHLLVIYPLRKASALILIMATLGASIFLSNTSALLFGTLPKALPPSPATFPCNSEGSLSLPRASGCSALPALYCLPSISSRTVPS